MCGCKCVPILAHQKTSSHIAYSAPVLLHAVYCYESNGSLRIREYISRSSHSFDCGRGRRRISGLAHVSYLVFWIANKSRGEKEFKIAYLIFSPRRLSRLED